MGGGSHGLKWLEIEIGIQAQDKGTLYIKRKHAVEA